MKNITSSPLHSLAATALAALLLAGCASTRHTFTPVPVTVQDRWVYASQSASAPLGKAQPAASGWWREFDDPVLDDLIEAALMRNNDLAAAAIRVRRAQLQAERAENRFDFSGSLGHNRQKDLDSGVSSRSSSFSLGASYEVDLWNRVGSAHDAAVWEAAATEQDRQSVMHSLVRTTATLYWQLAFLNQRLASTSESIEYARTTLNLVQVQYDAGSVSGLELAEARSNLASQQSALNSLQQQYVETANALVLLFDGSATGPAAPGWSAPQHLPDVALPTVDAGLPASLLSRRPDLQAAESRLRASFADIDATRASYYPSFSLTGSLGSASRDLVDVLSNPVAALGAGLSLPFLNATQMRLDIAISEAQYEEAVVNFRQTLYTALNDVENALSARSVYEQQARLLASQLDDARKVEQLNEIRYRTGAVPLKTWLDAQESRRNAEIALSENLLNRLTNHATLLQALGGGMPQEPSSPAADVASPAS